jgi:carboxypeptidase C (cathepsin A)
MFMKGIVLLSPVLNFLTIQFEPGNDLPYVLFLPAYTAAALYHAKLPAEYRENFKTTLEEVEQWALSGYFSALAKGNKLSPAERNTVIDKLALYTGLSRTDIDTADLRIDMLRFAGGLLRAGGDTVGRLDSRFKSKTAYSRERRLKDDPGYSAVEGPYVAAVNHYIREELKYVSDMPYRHMAFLVSPWDWGRGNRFVNEAETLRKAMVKNNGLKVFVAAGYYDLATPYFAADYTVSHLGLPPSLVKNIVLKHYEAGHMIYVHLPSLAKLRKDVHEFYGQK